MSVVTYLSKDHIQKQTNQKNRKIINSAHFQRNLFSLQAFIIGFFFFFIVCNALQSIYLVMCDF